MKPWLAPQVKSLDINQTSNVDVAGTGDSQFPNNLAAS